MAGVKEYKEDKYLGKGSFGEVLRVVRKNDKQVFAWKKTELDGGRMRKDQFAEFTTLSTYSPKFHSPFLIRLHDSFFTAKMFYMVIDYCGHGSLREKINHRKDRREPFTEEQALTFLCQLVHGTADLHRLNIIHRDLKPENVLIHSEGYLKITDFGTAKQLDSADSAAKTYVGTSLYMSPELFKREEYGMKADVFALGVIAHELVTLTWPFGSRDGRAVPNQVLKLPDPPKPANVSQQFWDLVVAMLRRDPKTRPTSEEVLHHPLIVRSLQRLGDAVYCLKNYDPNTHMFNPPPLPQPAASPVTSVSSPAPSASSQSVSRPAGKDDGSDGDHNAFVLSSAQPATSSSVPSSELASSHLAPTLVMTGTASPLYSFASSPTGSFSRTVDSSEGAITAKIQSAIGDDEASRPSPEAPRTRSAVRPTPPPSVGGRLGLKIIKQYDILTEFRPVVPNLPAAAVADDDNALAVASKNMGDDDDLVLISADGMEEKEKKSESKDDGGLGSSSDGSGRRREGGEKSGGKQLPALIPAATVFGATVTAVTGEMTCVCYEMEFNSGIWQISVRFHNSGTSRAVGFVDATAPRIAQFWLGDPGSVGYHGRTGKIAQNKKEIAMNSRFNDLQVVTAELNFENDPPTLHFFVDGEQQPLSISNVPLGVQFAVYFRSANAKAEIVSVYQIESPTAVKLPRRGRIDWAR
ncbi:putative Protein kinase domain containing protein [Monocercomonoides exilis]|uniref:putative Protein kinase domain containing protein n=1 Tax=Monocercomonoides exilis TaxID=2049356 RepID=UPI00355A5FAC|nr:putative Protein kinase domain containing protein [Monocercomonoides exilis]|eukprot:MONOS_1791.1-p1 / transcript=MONOS_1791.1 / gene=MONOS_1791 / organism=Monocercomonoides_exilis_PA203 / gene_product=Protein kinase domain containing proteine / transcript_product=Protein kinase domain containing proteine / location=Mono_scaffold00033:169577-172709(-) / protein_length=694 / sequence_SO=supercontig / SO=protein_coding / is_pseudo=false